MIIRNGKENDEVEDEDFEEELVPTNMFSSKEFFSIFITKNPTGLSEPTRIIYLMFFIQVSTNNERGKTLHDGARDIYKKLTLYMDSAKKNMTDQVPKAVTYYIIKKLVHYIDHDVIFTSMGLPSDDFVRALLVPLNDKLKFKQINCLINRKNLSNWMELTKPNTSHCRKCVSHAQKPSRPSVCIGFLFCFDFFSTERLIPIYLMKQMIYPSRPMPCEYRRPKAFFIISAWKI